jgi:glyoxylase-like metal-dependent hydrolase (beta-lactamase superfamily II)
VFLAASVTAMGLASAQAEQSPQALIDAAYQAMGGDAFTNLKTITISATVLQYDPGESYSVSNLLEPDAGTSTYVRSWDFDHAVVRTDWIRPKAGGGTRNFTELVMADEGYVTGDDTNGALTRRATKTDPPEHTMSGIRLTTTLRELERNWVVRAMHEHPDRVSLVPDQSAGGRRYRSLTYRGGQGTYTVLFDPMTHLPAVVRTREFDQLMGDCDFDQTLTAWRDVNGVEVPYHRVYTLNGVKVFDTTITDVSINPALPAVSFAVPDGLQGENAARPAPIGKTPYQWILRRLANGFFLDSDNLYTDDGGKLTLTDIGPDIAMVTGSTHNTVFVATSLYLVAFEAPGDDGQSQQAIALAKAKWPGKPVRYLVLTHHHIDHAGGLRAYMAEGATLVVGKGDGAFFRTVLAAPQAMNPYAPKYTAPKVIEVASKWTVKDGGREIEAYVIANPHAAGYLLPYIPDAKLGFVSDLWNPGTQLPPRANAGMIALVSAVKKAGIEPERFAGGHGFVGNYADLEQLVMTTEAR